MMSRYAKAIVLSSLIALVSALVIFQTGDTSANAAEHWVSVDASELQHIRAQRGSKDRTGLASAQVAKIVDQIAILRLNDQQMEALSSAMHDNFHKCSGFVAHESESDAVEFVRNFATATTEAQLVNYTIDNPQSVNTMLSYVSEPYTRQVIIDLSAFPTRRHDQPSGIQSANWIFNRWASLVSTYDRESVSIEYVTHPSNVTPQPSIVLTFKGTRFPDEIVVLGGHQDSIRTSGGATALAPGADDDASGIACLTDTIRVMAETGFRPERTVKFMAYAAEEIGLKGSNLIATDYRNQNKNVIGVMQLDMTNYKGTLGHDIVMFTDFTNAPQNQFITDLITTYQPTLNISTSSCGYACSDHASWHNKNYPASMPHEAKMGNSNTAIHTANDTIARSNNNADHAVKFTKLALSFIGELAKGCVAIGSRECSAGAR
jgi:bacterial leucyl aminopeptidase